MATNLIKKFKDYQTILKESNDFIVCFEDETALIFETQSILREERVTGGSYEGYDFESWVETEIEYFDIIDILNDEGKSLEIEFQKELISFYREIFVQMIREGLTERTAA